MIVNLRELLDPWVAVPAPACRITGLTIDSRCVKPGDLFVALKGALYDGTQYIQEALTKGAVAVLSETVIPTTVEVPFLMLPTIRHHLSEIAARFYDYPSRHLRILGVTGTNGKTSISHLVAQAYQQLGQPCGVIGTLGNGIYPELTTSLYTTPDAIALQALLSDFRQAAVKTVMMEVSSQGIAQGRVNALSFQAAAFTNLTRDHLDYHQTMENYATEKRKLFESLPLAHAILNLDDPLGEDIYRSLVNSHVSRWGYSLKKPTDITVVTAACDANGLHATIKTPWGEGEIISSLYGNFNLSNLLAVIGLLATNGLKFPDIIRIIPQLRPVNGRMQRLGGGTQPWVVIDYAHTPDALQQVLSALKSHCSGQLWCVFGCGGERDPGKRPQMGMIAAQFADHIVLTNDNPRRENPAEILEAIQSGITDLKKCVVEPDRETAIAQAIQSAKKEDIILIAGKGHETYQQIGEQKFPFEDKQVVLKYLERV